MVREMGVIRPQSHGKGKELFESEGNGTHPEVPAQVLDFLFSFFVVGTAQSFLCVSIGME